jgi:Concanavalin A-like lectin/glucanases superfamily
MKTRSATLFLGMTTLLWGVTALANLRSYQSAVTNEVSLISYYTFDQTNANDNFGPNNGALQGTAKLSPGAGGGQGLLLDGQGWVTLGLVPDFDFAAGTGTVEAWVRPDWSLAHAPGYAPCLFADRDLGPLTWSVHMNAVQDAYGVWNGTAYQAQPIPNPSAIGITGTNWHHVAVVWDNSSGSPTTTFYWDGLPVGQTAQGLGNTPESTQLGSSGASAANEGWIGMLDEVAFYSSALSSNSILAHYQAFVTNMPPVIIAQPIGGTFLAGIPLNLSVQVLGQNLSYQWYIGSTAIAHATNATLSIPSLAATNAGSYHVVVSCTAPASSVTSSNATVVVMSSLPPTLVAYQTAVKNTPGLISYYTFDQDNANDNVGSHNGTLAGTASLAPGFNGVPGLGTRLDGNGWVQLGSVTDFDFAAGTGTVEAWVQATWPTTFSAYNPCIFANRDFGTVNNQLLTWSVHMDASRSGVGVWNGNSWQPMPIPNPGTNWHHFAVVWDNSSGAPTTTIYWDGVEAGHTSQGLGPVPETTQLGSSTANSVSEGWIGMLDEVAFYSTALSADSVAGHYGASFAAPVITLQPIGGTFLPGVQFQLSVAAIGPNLTYQWYMNSNAIAGAKSPTLTFTSLAATNAGTYYVVVSNPATNVASTAVTVGVASPLPAALTGYQHAITNEPSLISYYSFDRLTANDSFGPNNGTLAGTTNFGPGIGGSPGAGLQLNGQGRVMLGTVADFDFPSGTGTAEAWVQAGWPSTFSSYAPCVFADRDSGPLTWSVHMNADKRGFGVWNGTTYEAQAIPNAGTDWHHLAVVWDNSSGSPTTTFYWDGVAVGQTAQSLGSTPESTQLGSSSALITAEGWIGMLDEVAFYSAALSTNAIQSHYAAFFGSALPVITTQPVGGAFLPGQPLTLTVWASGAYRTYQWFKDSSPITGETNSTLFLPALATTNTGTYFVKVSTPGGSTPSVSVSLQVGSYLANYQAKVLSEPGLISYYTFDASDAHDYKGSNNGSAVGSVVYDTGVGMGTDKCLILDGTDSVDLGKVAAFDFADGNGTLEAWIRMDWSTSSPPGYNPCLFADRNSGTDWSIHPTANQQSIGDWNGSSYQTVSLANPAGWHHLVITFGGGIVTYYWDGNQIGTRTQSVGGTTGLTTQLGSSLNASAREGWIGGMDEVALYSTTMAPSAVLSHFLAMTAPPPPPSIAYSLSGTNLTLSWPADATGFSLQYTPTLPASAWTPVSGVVNNQVKVDASHGNGFYRLKK